MVNGVQIGAPSVRRHGAPSGRYRAVTGSRSGSLKNLVVGVAVLLPAAVLSLFLVVVAAGLLGPTWGSVAIAAWLVVGVLVWTRAGSG